MQELIWKNWEYVKACVVRPAEKLRVPERQVNVSIWRIREAMGQGSARWKQKSPKPYGFELLTE